MNSRHVCALTGLLLGSVAAPVYAKPLSDLVSPEKRRSIVELAQRLTHPVEPAPLPGDLAQPFNPPNFEQPDPEEIRAAAAARAAANPLPATPAGNSGAPPPPTGDREVLENIAAQLPSPSGTMVINGKPRLVFGRKPIEIGSHFTITNPANGQDYDLELVAIEPPTYTLRYRNEEIIRPIKSGKSK
jgi:hypothetical protein